jgi:predicted phage terminase large subunit-like protein
MENASIEQKRLAAFGPVNTAVLNTLSGEDNHRRMMALDRLVRAKEAADDLIGFAQFTTPDPNNPEDSGMSNYVAKRHHRALAAALEQIALGKIKRLIISMPPRHGKTELCGVRFIPWYLAKFKGASAIYATYNENLAKDKGAEVKAVMEEPSFQQVFPNCKLAKGGKASGRMKTTNKNWAYFVGRGGSITGRGGDLIVVDDLFKNDEEADSPAMREKVWKWFTGTVMNRFMTDAGAMILVMTRWHEDDVIGRITDTENPNYNKDIAQGWDIVNIPAEAEHGDILGREIGEALWPERFGKKFLAEQKALNARRYSCLYQGNPSPEAGTFFLRDWVQYYHPATLRTTGLRKYGACDLSVGTKVQLKGGKQADRSAMIMFGVDANDDIYLLDAIINRDDSKKNTEAICDMIKHHKPITFFTYQDQITGSIGPFLFQRMKERRAYCHIEEKPSTGSKQQKAQAFKARMAMKKVYFPKGKFWANDIIDELVRFPGGKNDDCVDACALLGQGLDVLIAGSEEKKEVDPTPRVGTLAWLKHSDEQEKRRKEAEENGGF